MSDLSKIDSDNWTCEERRASILALESTMRKMPQIEVPIEHYFAPGLYLREMRAPAHAIITGKIHKTEHYCILAKGSVTVVTEKGRKHYQAPAVVHSMPGDKRALHFHEDTVWINVHHNPTDERDLDKIDAKYVADTFEDLYLTSARTIDDVIQYLGTTPEQMTAISENPDDQVDYPTPPVGVEIKPSPIHGMGVFVTRPFKAREVIAVARVGGKRTPAGRFCNHGAQSNAEMVMREDGSVDLIATLDIDPGAEVLSDYVLNFKNTRGELCRS